VDHCRQAKGPQSALQGQREFDSPNKKTQQKENLKNYFIALLYT
jgi:hypothetical protein